MSSVIKGNNNKLMTAIYSLLLRTMIIALPCAMLPGASFADTSRGHLTVSLAIINSADSIGARRDFGTSHYTWGAAEVALENAGYVKLIRVASEDEIYWFSVPVKNKPMVIGVSMNSGEIVHTSHSAN